MTSFFHKKIFFCRLLSCRHCKSATILHCDLTRKVTKQKLQKRLSMSQKWCNISEQNTNGVMAQLVARLNGIQKVRGSNPLGSTTKIPYILYGIFVYFQGDCANLEKFVPRRCRANPCGLTLTLLRKRPRYTSFESPWLHKKNIIHLVWYFFMQRQGIFRDLSRCCSATRTPTGW